MSVVDVLSDVNRDLKWFGVLLMANASTKKIVVYHSSPHPAIIQLLSCIKWDSAILQGLLDDGVLFLLNLDIFWQVSTSIYKQKVRVWPLYQYEGQFFIRVLKGTATYRCGWCPI